MKSGCVSRSSLLDLCTANRSTGVLDRLIRGEERRHRQPKVKMSAIDSLLVDEDDILLEADWDLENVDDEAAALLEEVDRLEHSEKTTEKTLRAASAEEAIVKEVIKETEARIQPRPPPRDYPKPTSGRVYVNPKFAGKLPMSVLAPGMSGMAPGMPPRPGMPPGMPQMARPPPGYFPGASGYGYAYPGYAQFARGAWAQGPPQGFSRPPHPYGPKPTSERAERTLDFEYGEKDREKYNRSESRSEERSDSRSDRYKERGDKRSREVDDYSQRKRTREASPKLSMAERIAQAKDRRDKRDTGRRTDSDRDREKEKERERDVPKLAVCLKGCDFLCSRLIQMFWKEDVQDLVQIVVQGQKMLSKRRWRKRIVWMWKLRKRSH